jgi:coenzyme F420-0:L-glutamate ligase/coenzyme F420-1:gamma-L-glutamate ligase
MTLQDFLRSRRSVRRFKPDTISDAVIERILTTATYAPSAHNLQPWRFVIVKNPNIKPRLARALTDKMRLDMQAEGEAESDIEKRIANSLRRIAEAPVTILLCRDLTAVRENAPEETIMNIQSTALAGLQLLLAAHAEGLAGNWICWPLYATHETQSVLNMPETWEPQAMFILGYADEKVKDKALKPIIDLVKII